MTDALPQLCCEEKMCVFRPARLRFVSKANEKKRKKQKRGEVVRRDGWMRIDGLMDG